MNARLPLSCVGDLRYFGHATKLALPRWFWAIYWISTDKGSISALRLSKSIGVTWRTAHLMLPKLRVAVGDRDRWYRLSEVIELDDALMGGKRPGKRGRGAEGKGSILVACENRDGRPGLVAMEVVPAVNQQVFKPFAKCRLKLNQQARTDALPALNSLSEHPIHVKQVTPAEKSGLLWVHMVISNLKRFLLGTDHG